MIRFVIVLGFHFVSGTPSCRGEYCWTKLTSEAVSWHSDTDMKEPGLKVLLIHTGLQPGGQTLAK